MKYIDLVVQICASVVKTVIAWVSAQSKQWVFTLEVARKLHNS